MAKILFNKKELEKHLTLSEKTLERLSLFGTPVESVNKDDVELEISANRADLFSVEGFLRSFRAFNEEKKPTQYKVSTDKTYTLKVDKSVKKTRPFIAAAIIKDLSLDDTKLKEIIYLQEKLHHTIGRNRDKCAIGIYPLDKIIFPVTYKAKKPEEISFVPLGSKDKLSAQAILHKHPIGKAHADLLKSEDRYPLIVDAKDHVLSMPPIINAEDLGRVNTNTKNIFIECTGKNKQTVDKVLINLATVFAEMGGKIYSCHISDEEKRSTPDLTPEKFKLNKDQIKKTLGLEIPEKNLKDLLAKMGHELEGNIVKVPAWRSDILHEVDLIEDIAIAYGYNNIVPEIPQISTIGQESKKNVLQTKIITILTGLGFLETSSLHLIKQTESENLKQKLLEVENARTEYSVLRPNLTIPLLRTLSENTNTVYPQKLVEIGTVFSDTPEGIKEHDSLCITLTPGNFTEAKRIVDAITSALDITYDIQDHAIEDFIDGRAGNILINNAKVGHIGELHPQTLNAHNLKLPTAIIEINLEQIYSKFGVQ